MISFNLDITPRANRRENEGQPQNISLTGFHSPHAGGFSSQYYYPGADDTWRNKLSARPTDFASSLNYARGQPTQFKEEGDDTTRA